MHAGVSVSRCIYFVQSALSRSALVCSYSSAHDRSLFKLVQKKQRRKLECPENDTGGADWPMREQFRLMAAGVGLDGMETCKELLLWTHDYIC